MSKKSTKVEPLGLKILMLLSNAFDPDPRVHREALALTEAGHKVTILCWDRDRSAKVVEEVDGITLLRVYVDSTHGRGVSQILYMLVFWFKAFWKGAKLDFDIIHAHDFDTLPLGYGLSKLKRTKLVYDAHESYVDMMYTLPLLIRKTIYYSENFLIKRADLVITVGEILKEYLEERGARNICIVGNWQDPEKFIFNKQAITEEKAHLGISPGQKIIVFIANLGSERRIPELINAVQQTSDIFLLLGGKGACAEQAREAADQFQNIAYLGYVSPDRVPFYTALGDIVFYGFDPDNPNARFSAPNKLFECLAAGKSMITGDFGEIGRIVRNMNCGVILADYSIECIRRAIESITDDDLLAYNRNSTKASQDYYSWQRAGEALLRNYPLTAQMEATHE